ncbi:MAG: hypothetical protein ABIF19_11720 [Planctomycetota bacterium]
MTIELTRMREYVRHLTMGIFVHFAAFVLMVNFYFQDTFGSRLTAGVRIVLACWAFVMVTNQLKRFWRSIKHPASYFLPAAAVLWVFNQRRGRLVAEDAMTQLRGIFLTWPDPSLGIVTGILDPNLQEQTLNDLLDETDRMRDSRAATIVDRMRIYLGEILKAVAESGNYQLLEKVMLRFSSFDAEQYRKTYERFLCLLSDIFVPSLPASFHRKFQAQMTGPLKNALSQAGETHMGHLQDIVGKIMSDDANRHETASSVAEMLLQLDWITKRDVCLIIFNESMKRAFRFPQRFGIEFLNVVSRLEHRLFWLDLQSLRNILEESRDREGEGLINSNLTLYNEICSRVLAPIEDPACDGICNARVFRRLRSDDGKVKIECVASDGKTCTCQGESLSFRGIYSKNCSRAVGERLNMNIMPIREVEQKFAVRASITPLHSYESWSQGPGRGAFFEEAEPFVVESLYDYVSTKE